MSAEPFGPFSSEGQARAAAHRVVQPEPGWSILRAAGNRELLRRALDGAGVETGAYDDRIAEWMGQWEDAVVAVVAGWITRAAGRADGLVDGMKPLLCRQMVRIGPASYDRVLCGKPIDHEPTDMCPGNPHARPAPVESVPRCEKCGRYPIDHRNGVCIYPLTDAEDLRLQLASTQDALEAAREAVRELGAHRNELSLALAEVRQVLDAFDWETDDRQYALEQIDDILNRDQT